MPELNDVNTGETIASQWGNDIRDRTIQRYADADERDTEHPSPATGDLSYLANTGDVDVFGPGGWTHIGAPVGTIKMHAGGSTPTGWLNCNGQAVSRSNFAALFAQIGTIWGTGDGSTTFNLPDLRGRTPRGVATSGTGDSVGATFGSDSHTHSGPFHFHSGASVGDAVVGSTQSAATAGLVNSSVLEGDATFGSTIRHTHNGSGNTGSAGTGNTGSSSTIQAGAAVVMLIKT